MRCWGGRVVALAGVLLGCGPSVTTGVEGSTSGGDETTTTSTSTSTSTSTTTTTTTTTSASTATSDSGGSTSTTADESSETTGGCSCEGMPIGLDDEVEEGFTPAELLAGTVFTDARWLWGAIAGDPETTTSGGASHRGGLVLDEVGGCCGNFICAPCPEGVTFDEVRLAVSTSDGRLADAFTGALRTISDSFELESDTVALASLQGTLPSDAFVDGPYAFTPTSVYLVARWRFDPELVLVEAELWGTNEDDQVRLGRYEPR